MIIKTTRREMRDIRHKRLRKRVSGTSERPRLAVYRSSKHIYAQIIDDIAGRTLVSACSLEPELRKAAENKGSTVAGAAAVGALVAQKAAGKGIKHVVYDRGGYGYMGRIAALAKAARDNGLEF